MWNQLSTKPFPSQLLFQPEGLFSLTNFFLQFLPVSPIQFIFHHSQLVQFSALWLNVHRGPPKETPPRPPERHTHCSHRKAFTKRESTCLDNCVLKCVQRTEGERNLFFYCLKIRIRIFHFTTHRHQQGQAVHTTVLAEQQVASQMETGITVHTSIWCLLVSCWDWLVAQVHGHANIQKIIYLIAPNTCVFILLDLFKSF